MKELWLFVVDTNHYAGNFEREMCSYMTGIVGDCGVGREYANRLKTETALDPDVFFHNVVQVPDEHGCYRPVVIWPTPGYFNDGMDNEYQIKAYVKSVTDYFLPYKKEAEKTLRKLEAGEPVGGWTISSAKQSIASNQAHIDRAKKMKKIHRYPAYMSVGIWFDSELTKEQITVLKERAAMFCKTYEKEDIKIGGFRIVKEKTTTTERKV
jgi:hypothetical protein